MILDTDQRKLLKLRSSVLLDSGESDSKSIFKAKKVTDKQKMLDIYVENLRQKKLDKRDVRLLEVTGLSEILELLKERQIFNRKMNLGKGYTKTGNEMVQQMWKGGININDLTDIMEEKIATDIELNKSDHQQRSRHTQHLQIPDISQINQYQRTKPPPKAQMLIHKKSEKTLQKLIPNPDSSVFENLMPSQPRSFATSIIGSEDNEAHKYDSKGNYESHGSKGSTR